jgi:hypothetical protein
MKRLLTILALLAAAPAQATDCTLSADDWARPRSGDMVLSLPAVATCVRAWQLGPQQRLVLIHAPGESGALWAAELRDWLVALGVPSSQIDLRAVGSEAELLVRVEAPPLSRG